MADSFQAFYQHKIHDTLDVITNLMEIDYAKHQTRDGGGYHFPEGKSEEFNALKASISRYKEILNAIDSDLVSEEIKNEFTGAHQFFAKEIASAFPSKSTVSISANKLKIINAKIADRNGRPYFFLQRINELAILTIHRNIKSIQENSTKLAKESQKEYEKICHLNGLAAANNVASNYNNVKESEKASAFWWNLFSIFFVFFAIFSGIFSFFDIKIGQLETTASSEPLYIAPVVVACLFGATMCARRAGMHHDNARSAQWLYLVTTNIESYSSMLDGENAERVKFISKVGEQIFTQFADKEKNSSGLLNISNHLPNQKIGEE